MGSRRVIFNTDIVHYPIREEWAATFRELGYEYRGAVCRTDDDIIAAVYAWHDSKKRFAEDRLRKALQWMRDKGLVPKGHGHSTELAGNGEA